MTQTERMHERQKRAGLLVEAAHKLRDAELALVEARQNHQHAYNLVMELRRRVPYDQRAAIAAELCSD